MTTTSIENHTLERLIDAWDTTVLPKHHDGAMQEWMESLRHEFMTCKQNAMNELTNDQLHDIWLKTSPEEWDFARAIIAADRAQQSARHREELLAYEVTVGNLRARLEQAQPYANAHDTGAGAIYDFMGWLTTRPEKLILSGSDDAAPAAEAVSAFLDKRGISKLCNPNIMGWSDAAPQAQPEQCGHCGRRVLDPPWPVKVQPERKPMTNDQITKLLDRVRMQWVSSPPTYEVAPAFARAVEAFHGIGGKP